VEVLNPLMQSPLAGGAITRPADNQLQGDALVKQMQMRMQQRDQKTPAFMAYFRDVMDTKGYPTKTMQEYESQLPEYIPQQVPLGVNISSANFNTSPPEMLNVMSPSEPKLVEIGTNLPEIPKAIRSPGLPPPSQLPPVGINNLLGKVEGGIGALNPYDNQFNLFNNKSLDSFVDNMINNKLKEFFGGIMDMLNV
jgi:hypothetical protein